MEETCEFASLKSLAYLTKDGEYKLLDTAEMSPTMAEAAAEQVRASYPQHRHPSACLTFPRARLFSILLANWIGQHPFAFSEEDRAI